MFNLPETVSKDFSGSTFTIHYYTGTDTKGTGTSAQIENKFNRISPQLNLRWKGLDLQAAYVIAKDDNWSLVANPTEDFKYNGIALDCGYMINEKWNCAVHFDSYSSDNEVAGVKILDYKRIVPALTYIIHENIRTTAYYEADISDKDSNLKVSKFYLNIRTMF